MVLSSFRQLSEWSGIGDIFFWQFVHQFSCDYRENIPISLIKKIRLDNSEVYSDDPEVGTEEEKGSGRFIGICEKNYHSSDISFLRHIIQNSERNKICHSENWKYLTTFFSIWCRYCSSLLLSFGMFKQQLWTIGKCFIRNIAGKHFSSSLFLKWFFF